MAAGRPISDEKSEFPLSSPSTLCASDFNPSSNYDCEAAKNGPSAPRRTTTWRSIVGLQEPQKDPEREETLTRQLEQCPNGYPRLAAFLSSDYNFSVYRAFGYLHARVLLNLQDQIAALERELDQKDDWDQSANPRRLYSRIRDERESRRDEDGRTRAQILDEIRCKLLEYDEMLMKSRDIASFQRPSFRDYTSVRNWVCNLKPLIDREQAFVKHKEDVITLHSGREWSSFDGFVESMLLKIDCRLVRWAFLTPELRAKTTDKHVHYYTRKRVDIFVGLVITLIIFVLLILPVVAMYRLTTFGHRPNSTFNAIGVLVVFTLLFSAAMSLLTKAQRHELFAASAAYCAVLVVFISNFSD